MCHLASPQASPLDAMKTNPGMRKMFLMQAVMQLDSIIVVFTDVPKRLKDAAKEFRDAMKEYADGL